jgi:hypothetical protein
VGLAPERRVPDGAFSAVSFAAAFFRQTQVRSELHHALKDAQALGYVGLKAAARNGPFRLRISLVSTIPME